ncbi:MAG: PIN domain-containing protein [Deltaproteobacteria bacterium]|nr:MAG: PIN domain-containing protein [Deltaproteobacteria bacterium]
MIFWDSSALVPLVVKERQSQYCLEILSSDQEMLVWCLSKVEVVSALCRKLREGALDQENFREAKTRLEELLAHAHEVRAIDKVRTRALRLLEVHPLRAADACQHAAALVATQEGPTRVAFLTFDKRLEEVAQKEGFTVNPTAL